MSACIPGMRYVNWHTGGVRLSTPFSLSFRRITQTNCVTAAVTNATSISLYGIAEEVSRLSTLLTPLQVPSLRAIVC